MALLGAVMALTMFSGCLQVDSLITVKKDGSGTIQETISFGAQAYGMMKMSQAQEGAEDPLADFDEESLKEQASKYGEGIEFVGVEKVEKDGGLVITATYKFDDITKVSYSPGTMMDTEEELAVEEEDKASFGFDDGVLTVTLPEPDSADLGFGDEEASDEEMAMMAPMLAGMKMTARIEAEGGIAETNATYQDGDEVVLLSFIMDEILTNEGGISALKKIEGAEGREAIAKTVSEIKGLKMETKEKVTIEIK